MSSYQPSAAIRIGNRVVTPLIEAGFPMGRMALLTVMGRKSGLPRTTPVSVAPTEKGWRLIAPFGEVDWVKNMRAAGDATLTRRRRSTPVAAVEQHGKTAAVLLRESLEEVGPLVRAVVGKHFEVTIDDTLDRWVDEATRHPVFLLEPI